MEDMENIGTGQAGTTETAPSQELQDKTFTQAELDEIVQSRLARERKRLNDMISDDEGIKQELLASRLQLDMAKKLTEKGLSHAMLDLLDYSSTEKCNATYEKVIDVFGKFRNDIIGEIYKINGRTPERGSSSYSNKPSGDPLRDIFQAK